MTEYRKPGVYCTETFIYFDTEDKSYKSVVEFNKQMNENHFRAELNYKLKKLGFNNEE